MNPFLALLALACGRPQPTAVPIGSVREAPAQETADALRFTGVARTDALGRHGWTTPAQRGPTRDPERPRQAMWVVPVLDPDAGPERTVHLWVTPGYAVKWEDDPEAWFAQLREGFDRHQVEAPVRARAGEGRGSGWERAIADAERVHGLRSAPAAPVVAWPADK